MNPLLQSIADNPNIDAQFRKGIMTHERDGVFDDYMGNLTERRGQKLVTIHEYPPIPVRDHDWRALFEGDDEDVGRHGWGRTEDEAIVDLVTRVGQWATDGESAVRIAKALGAQEF